MTRPGGELTTYWVRGGHAIASAVSGEDGFVPCYSDNHWAGIFSDLYIEQILMRNIESVGVLTTGRGLHETTRVVWLSSANYNPLSIIW